MCDAAGANEGTAERAWSASRCHDGYIRAMWLCPQGATSGNQKRQTRSKSNPHCLGVRALPREADWFAHVAPFVDGAELTDPSNLRLNR